MVSDKQVMNVITTFLLIGISLILLGIATNTLWTFGIGTFILIIYTISFLCERHIEGRFK